MPTFGKFSTPCYVINLCTVKKNFLNFGLSIQHQHRNDIVAYSIKANYDKNIIDVLNSSGAYFEVSSIYEQNILLNYGICNKKIITNIFYNNYTELIESIHSNYLVIIGSLKDLFLLSSVNFPISIGLRINLDFIRTNKECYFYTYSRFGLKLSDNMLNIITKNKNIKITCLHCHMAGNTRNPLIYKDIVDKLCKIILKYNFKDVQFIDIGGGYKIDKSFWKYDDYISTVLCALKENSMEHIKLIYEPGNAIVRTCCKYLTEVIEFKHMNGKYYIMVDGTRLHINPHNQSIQQDFSIFSDNDTILPEQIIVGNTCKESDLLLTLNNYPLLQEGDIIQINNLGAYLLNEVSNFLLPYPTIYYSHLDE